LAWNAWALLPLAWPPPLRAHRQRRAGENFKLQQESAQSPQTAARIGSRALLGCSSSRTKIKPVAEMDLNGEYTRFAYYFKGNYQFTHTD
jgi:hypothetical protein